MASRVGTSQHPAPDKVTDPIKWERRRKTEARKQARIDEANTDEFAGHVQDYAHENGLNAQQVLDTEKAARARGNAGNAGLNRHIKDSREFQQTGQAPPAAKPGEASGNVASWKVPTSARGAAGSAGGFVLGLFLYGFVLNGLRYGTAGLKAFAEAKFFNKITTGPWSSSTSPTSPSTAPGTVGEAPGQLPFYLVTPSPQAGS